MESSEENSRPESILESAITNAKTLLLEKNNVGDNHTLIALLDAEIVKLKQKSLEFIRKLLPHRREEDIIKVVQESIIKELQKSLQIELQRLRTQQQAERNLLLKEETERQQAEKRANDQKMMAEQLRQNAINAQALLSAFREESRIDTLDSKIHTDSFIYSINTENTNPGNFGKYVCIMRKTDNSLEFEIRFRNTKLNTELPATPKELGSFYFSEEFSNVTGYHKDFTINRDEQIIGGGGYMCTEADEIVLFGGSGEYGLVPTNILQNCITQSEKPIYRAKLSL